MAPSAAPRTRAAIGIPGLDDILRGGLVRNRLYVVEGVPGSGKTTLAVQYLLEGARLGEPVLYVTLSETEEELREVATSHNWDLRGIHIREIVQADGAANVDDQYTMFHPSEVELGETTKSMLADIDRIRPTRVVIDSLSELRLLAGNPLRYRRQILGLKRHFGRLNCTVLLLDDLTTATDLQVQSLAHGVIRLEQLDPEYGAERRRLQVVKYRGVGYRGGFHDFAIRPGGLRVFPRLVAAEHPTEVPMTKLSSGITGLDTLLGGGIERGTSTLIVGAAGVGKSSLAAQFVAAEAARGGHAAMFVFDESPRTLLTRAAGLGMDIETPLRDGRLRIQQIDPAELSPGEFADSLRRSVDDDRARVIVIDSLNGYLNAMPGERYLVVQLHEILTYLGQAGVATLLIGAHQGLVSGQMVSPVDASYLADAVVLLRYFEMRGEIRQAISVVKKRGGSHERTIREFRMHDGRIDLGPPLRDYRGVLTGVPVHESHTELPGGRDS